MKMKECLIIEKSKGKDRKEAKKICRRKLGFKDKK